jgi:hypothetical protein
VERPLAALLAAVQGSGADYLIPGDDKAVWLLHELARQSPEMQALVERSIGSAAGFAVVHSRVRLLELAAELGITLPETAAAPSAEAAQLWAQSHPRPFVLKKDGTFGGEGVEVIDSLDAIAPFYARLGEGGGSAEISVQAHVDGTAANAMFACHEGRLLGEVQAMVLAAKGKTGPSLAFQILRDEQITRAGALLASALKLSGFFGLDFILDRRTGVPMLIELNPRCTQLGHVLLREQGDLVACLWESWSGTKPSVPLPSTLPHTVYFHPAAREWAIDKRLLSQGRPDVCAEDVAVVDELALGDPALHNRLPRHARRLLGRLRDTLYPQPSRIHYFGPGLGEPMATNHTRVLSHREGRAHVGVNMFEQLLRKDR